MKKIVCTGCGSVNKPSLVTNAGVYYTCKRCGNTFWISKEDYERRAKK